MRTVLLTAVLIASLALPAAAADSAVDKAKMQAIIDKTPGAADVWTMRDNGDLQHKLSGFACPAKFPTLDLWHLLLYGPKEAPGTDVGCDYGRGIVNPAEAKLTVFFVQQKPGETLDSVFQRYQAEIHKSLPDAKSIGPALTVKEEGSKKNPLPDFRSDEYEVKIDGRRAQTDLIVSLVDGWVIEIRATYFMDRPENTGDLALPAFAWVMVVGSKTPAQSQ